MRRLVAKAARHAAAARFNQLRLRTGDKPKHLHDGADRAEGFLVAMAVQQDRLRDRFQLLLQRLQLAGRCLARQKFFKQQGVLADRLCGFTQTHDQGFVTQREQAGWLQPNDGDAFGGEWQQGIDQLSCLGFGLVNHTAGEESSAAAKGLAVRC